MRSLCTACHQAASDHLFCLCLWAECDIISYLKGPWVWHHARVADGRTVFVQGLEGKSASQLEQQLRENWAESVVTNWKLWVPCQIINLGFVPGHLQVLVSNFVALAWNSYMSYITHRPASTGQ